MHMVFHVHYLVFQIDDDMTAKLDLCHTRFSFMENELVYTPNWMAPERIYTCTCTLYCVHSHTLYKVIQAAL